MDRSRLTLPGLSFERPSVGTHCRTNGTGIVRNPVSDFHTSSCLEVTDVQHSRPGRSDQARHHLAGPRRRVQVLAAWLDALRRGLVIRFVRNDQPDVIFHRLSLPELAQPSTRMQRGFSPRLLSVDRPDRSIK
jgi:hypothetical protein